MKERLQAVIASLKQLVQHLMDTPAFVIGQPNPANGSNTRKLREIIGDEFGLGKEGDVLNCTEYVQWKVRETTGKDIVWPATRPRNGGSWPMIFSKARIYGVSSIPRSSTAMAFKIAGTPGHVCFVEEVTRDGSVRVSEANWPNQGIYNERLIPEPQWKAYGARFIDFS